MIHCLLWALAVLADRVRLPKDCILRARGIPFHHRSFRPLAVRLVRLGGGAAHKVRRAELGVRNP